MAVYFFLMWLRACLHFFEGRNRLARILEAQWKKQIRSTPYSYFSLFKFLSIILEYSHSLY